MERQARRTPSAPPTFRCTPPTSVLWVRLSECSLTATGKPDRKSVGDGVTGVQTCALPIYGAPGQAHAVGTPDVQMHAPDIGLMGEAFGVQLDRDGEAEVFGRGHGGLLGEGEAGFDSGNAGCGDHPLRLILAQEGGPGLP